MNPLLPRLLLLLSALPSIASAQPAETPTADNAALGMRLQITPTCRSRDADGRCRPIQQRDTAERPAPVQIKGLTPASTEQEGRPVVTTAF